MSTGDVWSPDAGLRISDAEREAAVSALGEHYAAGRLTREEYDERADRALAARTAAEVTPLFTDLPAPHPYASSSAGPWPPYRVASGRGRRLPLLPVVLVLVALAVLLHAPFLVFLVLGVLWCGRSRRRC